LRDKRPTADVDVIRTRAHEERRVKLERYDADTDISREDRREDVRVGVGVVECELYNVGGGRRRRQRYNVQASVRLFPATLNCIVFYTEYMLNCNNVRKATSRSAWRC